jgi:hypothetical protein
MSVVIVVSLVFTTEAPLEQLAQVATALGPVFIVASAYLVIRQVREAAAALRGQLFDAAVGRILDLDRIFVLYPGLRPYFYDGADLEDADANTRAQVLALAELHLDFLDSELLRRQEFPKPLERLPSLEPWLKSLLKSSPAMRTILRHDVERGEDGWYSDKLHRLYREVAATRQHPGIG